MKFKLNYIALSILLAAGTSCSKDFLDRRPRDLIIEDDAYGSQSGIEALTVKLYNDMLLEDFSYEVAEQAGYLSTVTDEAVRSYTWGAGVINGTVLGNWFGSWDYAKIRRVNSFIEKIPTSKVSDDLKARFLAEARYIRAFHYFQLVKRYGGVPLVTKTQEYAFGDDVAGLFVPRSKEDDIYAFIEKELTDIKDILPTTNIAVDQNRINRFTALALKSRAMLYAASIAKYGQVQIDGLVGIPKGKAEAYWRSSLAASQEIINEKQYSLYKGDTDKSLNFQNLFLKENNSEVIFNKVYRTPEVGHSYDFFNAPQSFKVDYGCATSPTLDLVEEYEYTDGSSGELKTTDKTGNPIVYANPYDIFKNKDPRLLATIMLPFSAWQGGELEIRRGVLRDGQKVTAENLTTGYPETGSNFKIVGKDGPLTTADPTKTGFYVKKSMDPTKRVNDGESVAPYIVFRYGEILLNYAEAAFELGLNTDALKYVNEIRERAGIALKSSINLEQIRHERKVELAFENHRLWDLRRWRTATSVLNNTQFHALYPWLVWEEGKDPSQMKYIFEKVNAPKNTRTFPEKLYYEPLPQGAEPYIQNPLY
ncbi:MULTISPECIES: RagB/SusD family nutrient uptake outer membrane protein [unclassified Sphingobacterium]|uniref:RagB/SusD family nutrient uptake outer membrane protein n=1 Tax=unclassified Sphingobacterium TaxID=2609468 RepID=UPI001042F5B6|nr:MULTISPECIES: RagB/SusD family nutrient uptake outer membrane protein [unclassified Sphingobacterium]MCS3556809.1 hypothetical protein [Sphingobacterium sp. JUb21]TCQ99265.1 putative outer membrane starch-binding protein [Sphingobacterium sp. JUb20]